MLVLSRKVGERIFIGDDIVVQVVEVAGRRARLGIEAPPQVVVMREEAATYRAWAAAPNGHRLSRSGLAIAAGR